jgi:toxin YoeB
LKWELLYSRQAQKDAEKIKRAGLGDKVHGLLDVLEQDPFSNPPPYEKLLGDFEGYNSRRITLQHRLVYLVDKKQRVVTVARMWTHYE